MIFFTDKNLFFVLFLFVAVCNCEDENVSEELYNELPCLTYGGQCLHKSECPVGRLSSVSGLCPVQQEQQVECCYSESSMSCKRRGGECISKISRCPDYLTFHESTDCSKNEKCCIHTN